MEGTPVGVHGAPSRPAVHDAGFVRYLEKVCAQVPEGQSVYPYVFPIRNAARPPKELAELALHLPPRG